MAINLDALQQAASRYEDYEIAIAKAEADPEISGNAEKEKQIVAERHRDIFVPAAERLLAKQTAILAGIPPEPLKPRRQRIRPAETPLPEPPVDVTPVLPPVAVPTPDDLIILDEGELIPEVMQRDNDLRPMRFLQIGLLAARSVGRIRISDNPITEEGDATGFMVAPGLLMTNWHVLKNEDFAAAASVFFDDEDGLDGTPMQTQAFRLRPDRLFVNDEALDYAIVEVANRTSSGTPLAQYGYLPLFRQTGKLDPLQREAANIIQHPGGGPKKIAIRDNYIKEIVPDAVDPLRKETSLFYGTDTLKGSSGSPVCSDQWYVVALHRGGVPETMIINGQRVVMRHDGNPATRADSRNSIKYLANEGTRISRIYHSLDEKKAANQNAAIALERLTAFALDPRSGPLSLRTAPIMLPGLPSAEEGGIEEITNRGLEKFAGSLGYKPAFLGNAFRIPLPGMTSDVKRELATLKDSTKTELKYTNFSLKMNVERRTAVFVAGNIDGSKHWKFVGNGSLPKKRPGWSFDPRMDKSFQPDDEIFSQSMQRGHLFKREDAFWGSDKAAMLHGEEHSHTITNATPMIANFNNVEWGNLEDIVTRESIAGNKISYFTGPVFRSTDRFFNELRVGVPPSELRTGMRVPESFWKIVFWVEAGNLKAAGFVLFQTDEIAAHGSIIEEINFGTYRKTRITDIEQMVGLKFPKLVAVDTFDA